MANRSDQINPAALVRSSAAEYLSFIAATGAQLPETVLFSGYSNLNKRLRN